MSKLQITLAPGSQIEHLLTEEVVTIGRAPDNNLVIDDPSVSGHHARLTPDGGNYVLEDLGSTNGTRINNKGIGAGEKHVLKAGDKIRFGRLDAVYDPEHASGETIEMPEASEPALAPASKSVKPSNFMNASPFQKKKVKKDPIGTAGMVLAGIAVAAVLAVTVLVFQLKP